MSSLHQLLATRGNTAISLGRAIQSLYSNLGRNIDDRNWAQILASADPLAASEAALVSMYQDSAYLLRNANNLLTLGYTDNQIAFSYQQMAQRLGFVYSPLWASDTSFAQAANTGFSDVLAAATTDQQVGLPIPTIGVAAAAGGFTITLSETGQLSLSVSGSLGSASQGQQALGEQNALSSGNLILRGTNSQKTSTATGQFFVLGTAGGDNIDTSAAGARVDYIAAGRGDDTINAGAGNDYLLGGAGGDELTGASGDDTLVGGTGWDTLIGGPGTDYIFLNSGELEFEKVVLDMSTDDADVIDGFHFGGGLGGNGFDRMDLTAPNGMALIGGGANTLTVNINGGNGTLDPLFPADTAPNPGGFLPTVRTMYVIAGNDQLGVGTTIGNAAARALAQLADGAQDFLALTTGANQGGLVLMTDDGTSHFLLLVVDTNNNQITDAGEVTLIGQFVNSTNIANITMTDFNV